MKMKLVIWTSRPSFDILKKTFRKASSLNFRSRSNNSIFLSELYISTKEFFAFCTRIFYEAPVNIYHGMPSKFRKIKKELKVAESKNNSINLFKIILDILDTKPVLHGEIQNLNEILKRGNPILLIANHPYVPIDGFSIMSIIHKYRSDYSVVINTNDFLYSLYPQFSHHFIPVKITEGLRGRNSSLAYKFNVRALRKCHKCLDSGQCLIIFPAGQGSKAKEWGEEIKDPKWLNGVGLIVKRFVNSNKPLTILPIFIAGHMGGDKNSHRYLKAVIESPLKLGAALQHALFETPSTINMYIGKELYVEEFNGMSKIDITQKLRTEVYNLADEILIANR